MSNLLTKEEKKLVRKEYYMRVAAVAVTLLFISCILSITELLPSFFYSSVSQTLKNNELESITGGMEADKEISKTLKRVDLITAFLNEEDDDAPTATELFREVLIARPEGVTVSGFTLESKDGKRALAISGVASLRSDLITFVDDLRKRSLFLSTDIPAENLAKAEDIAFTVRITGDF